MVRSNTTSSCSSFRCFMYWIFKLRLQFCVVLNSFNAIIFCLRIIDSCCVDCNVGCFDVKMSNVY
ncbi:hypothetical protein RchiOBHm_Chr2g0149521 [Rosa chinensis]|uniref:Uncharacterized protein n=1 Tax=Rosa chinensis TaxID=74649 RepID=A0A2P6RZP3_ROSCH|nr:hypothetical protein RchiOBHm_Chr2g0149521 [Rosa chinensis]